VDRLALATLNSAMDSYESVDSVRAELAEFLGQDVSEERLFSVFRCLEAEGFLKAHRVDPRGGHLMPTTSTENDAPSDIWFIVTAEGREVVDREWGRAFGNGP
jgi:hypothetical protein